MIGLHRAQTIAKLISIIGFRSMDQDQHAMSLFRNEGHTITAKAKPHLQNSCLHVGTHWQGMPKALPILTPRFPYYLWVFRPDPGLER